MIGIVKKRCDGLGRKQKFGEASDFVSVRVPKSKRKDYRIAIKRFVEKMFASECISNERDPIIRLYKIEPTGFWKFEEFVDHIKKDKSDNQD
ncbi:MAG: hypothetical protein ACFFCV_06480 [Promethearchaeota archaeon]